MQRVTVTATGGTFTIAFDGETTAPIAFNAPSGIEVAGSVAAALHAQPQMKAIQVRPAGTGETFTLEFTNAGGAIPLGGRSFPAVTCNGSSLTGAGAGCAVEVNKQGFTTNLVEKFDSAGQPVTSWGEGGELNGSSVTTPPDLVAGPFAELAGMAVDTSGNLWVSGGNSAGRGRSGGIVFEFGNDASVLTGWTGESGELAVDASDNLYFEGTGVHRYTSAGELVGVVAPSSTEYLEDNFQSGDEAIDPATSSLYVAGNEGFSAKPETFHGVVKRYDLSTCTPVITHEPPEPGCAAVESFGATLISPDGTHPVAVDSATNALYVGDREHVTSFSLLTVPDVTTTDPAGPTSSSATFTGTVNPSGVELNAGLPGCRFEWGETTAPYEHTVACGKSAGQIGAGSAPVEVRAAVSGLQAGRTYHYRLVASNANDVNVNITEPSVGGDVSFGPPLLESASALDVTATSATIQAQVNPNDIDTHVRVEYGSEAGVYTQSTPVADVGSAGTVQAPAFGLTELVAGEVYHYRVVAENVLGEGGEAVRSLDHTFTTQTASVVTLLDGRGWELVSPPDKHGALVMGPSGEQPIQAAANGEAIAYTASAPTEPGAAGDSGEVEVLSARSAAGWSSRDLATPNAVVHGGDTGPEYRYFSSDLSFGVVEPNGPFSPEISPEASEQTPYVRTDFPAGAPGELCTSGCYRPLVTGAPGFANVPAGTEFGRIPGGPLSSAGQNGRTGVGFFGASPDARHLIVSSRAPLIEGAPNNSLYEWSEGHLVLISILPDGSPAARQAGTSLYNEGGQRGVVSSDGSRVVWTENEGGGSSDHMYLRDVPAEQTLQLDANHGGTGKGPGYRPQFQMASADDSVVLFTDEQQLTPNSGAAVGHPDLYRCQVVMGESGELECALSDLTPALGANSSGLRGILGASEDGSSVYFVANGVLAADQVDHGAGVEEALPGGCGNQALEEQGTATCNLYLYREGVTSFITRLSSADGSEFGLSGPARVSSSGRWLALMSQRSLTGYDNRDISTGKPTAEVYLYDAQGGSLVCASCNPSGARPRGEEYNQLAAPRGHNDIVAWDSRLLVSGFLPGASVLQSLTPISPYESRSLSDSGRLFFNSLDGLVAQDSNGTEDVYEYEPPGVGSCREAGPGFVAGEGGCVGLVSSGASQQESVFMDASESGDDVFFLTASRLSPLDLDSSYDVYDARVDGGDREAEKPIECQGDACQSIVEPPNDVTPGSLTFSGPGNLKPLALLTAPASKQKPNAKKCPKGRKLKHGKCVKAKKASKGKRKANNQANKRGVKR